MKQTTVTGKKTSQEGFFVVWMSIADRVAYENMRGYEQEAFLNDALKSGRAKTQRAL